MELVSLYGKPLTGKGTQAKFFIAQGFFHLPMGDYMRDQAAQGDLECQEVMALIEAGELVPDALVCGIAARVIEEKERQGFKGVLLDGFPRTLKQAEMLDALAQEKGMPLTVIELQVSDNNVLNARRLKRIDEFKAAGKEPRPEDLNEKKFWRRIEVYDSATAPVADHYEAKGLIRRIDGLLPPQAVWDRIKVLLNLENGPDRPRLPT